MTKRENPRRREREFNKFQEKSNKGLRKRDENQGFKRGYTFPRDLILSLGEASRALGYTLSLKRPLPRAIAPLKRREIGRKPGPTLEKSVAEIDRMITYRINRKR